MVKGEEQTLTAEEMLEAQAKVFNMVMGYMGSMSLKCAVELGIPDLIHHSPGRSISLSSLLSHLPSVPAAKAPFLLRVMRLLAQMGFFTSSEAQHREGEEEEETSYSLTPLSAILLKDSPVSLSPWLRGILCPPHVNTWQSLGRWLQSNTPGCAFEHEHGKSMWELASLSPEINALVNEFMAGDTRLTMTAVVDRCKDAFRGVRTLVDVGGGTGASARAIARAFPRLKCTVFDLPHVIAAVPEDSLVDAVGGDMFERIPRADAIFRFRFHSL